MAQAADAPRTVTLTVDDDPGVFRAVARDLRRRYGESYRIVRAESGESALEIDLKDRVSRVVAFNSYDCPQGGERGNGLAVGKTRLPEDFITELLRSGRRKGYDKVARGIFRSLTGFDRARERYPRVSAPVTLVHSEND